MDRFNHGQHYSALCSFSIEAGCFRVRWRVTLTQMYCYYCEWWRKCEQTVLRKVRRKERVLKNPVMDWGVANIVFEYIFSNFVFIAIFWPYTCFSIHWYDGINVSVTRHFYMLVMFFVMLFCCPCGWSVDCQWGNVEATSRHYYIQKLL